MSQTPHSDSIAAPATGPILGLSGSLRAGSSNSLLLAEAARLYGGAYRAGNLDLPLYRAEIEQAAMPDAVLHLAQSIADAPAVIIATPEYNSGLSGVLKNALDWVSRTKLRPFAGKPVAVMSAAAGITGGARAQVMLRACLTPFRARIVAGPDVMLGDCRTAFDADGRLIREGTEALLADLMAALHREAD